ncbi:MAG: hypothetical protein AAB672_01520, partial [Patescibacteria group bacterium]
MDETYQQNQRPALRRPVRAIPKQQEQKKERITKVLAACMVITALCFDAFNALLTFLGVGLVVSSVISPVATFGFVIWFWTHGITFTKSPKKFAAMGIQSIIGLIPGLNILPELTLGVLITVLLTRSED